MLPHELEKILERVAWGKRFIRVKDGNGSSRILILKSLDLRDKNWINFVYHDSLSEAINSGILSEKELRKELELRGLWTPEQEKYIEQLEEERKNIKQEVEEAKDTRERRRFDKTLEKVEKKLEELLSEKAARFLPAAERFAETNRMHAIVFSMAYDEEERKIWRNWSEFEQESDFVFVLNIIMEINKLRGINEREVREIARSSAWRYLWNAGKACGDLFGRPIVHLDSEQQALVYWSEIYDSVYDAHERPADEIINNDEKLDKWFKDQATKKSKEKNKKAGNPLGLSDRIMRHGEVFVAVDQEIKPSNGEAPKPISMKEVREMNSPSIQNWKNRQLETIKQKGVINEKELRPQGDRESRGNISSSDAVLGKMRKGARGMPTRDVVKRFPGGTL